MEFPGQLVVDLNGEGVKTRSFIVLTGFSLTNDLGVYSHSVGAVVDALLERFFYVKRDDGNYAPPIQAVPGKFTQQYFRTFRREVLRHVPHHFPRLTRRQLVDSYSGLKRKRYENAYKSLRETPLNRQDSAIKLFCKFSKTKLGDPARVISPRDPRFNLELGRYVKHLEKRLYKCINKTFHSSTQHTVMKGLNVDERALVLRQKWCRFNEPVAISLDASKLDASIQRQQLLYEHSFYTGVYPWARALRVMLFWMRTHNCVAYAPDGRVRVRCAGRRASGDVTTSLGNVLIMCSCIYALCCELGIELELADDGDDAMVMMEREDLDRFIGRVRPHFRECGITIKVEAICYEFEQMVFCQHNVVNVAGKWRMCREVRKVLAKDTLCLTGCPNEKALRKWIGAVAAAGMHLCDGVPILEAFYAYFRRCGRAPSDRFFQHVMQHTFFARRKVRHRVALTAATRLSFFLATGVMPDAQVAMERWLESLTIEELQENVVDQHLVPIYQGGHLELISADSR